MVRAIGSYPIGHKFESHRRYQNKTADRRLWPRGQEVKTPPFHGGIMGSIPVGVTKLELSEHHYYRTVGSDSFFVAAKGIGSLYKSRANQAGLLGS